MFKRKRTFHSTERNGNISSFFFKQFFSQNLQIIFKKIISIQHLEYLNALNNENYIFLCRNY